MKPQDMEKSRLLHETSRSSLYPSQTGKVNQKTGLVAKLEWVKVLQTVNMCFAYSTSGIMTALFGVAFLDLIAITKSDVTTGSLIFVFCGLGAVLGSVMFGLLPNKVPGEMILPFYLM